MKILRESIFGVIVLLVALPSMFVGCSSKESAEKKASAPPAPKVTVSKAVKAKAVAPEPGPTAAEADSFSGIGKGDASVSGAGHAPADYVSWAEAIDVADDGTPVQTDVAMDNKHKVLYLSDAGACAVPIAGLYGCRFDAGGESDEMWVCDDSTRHRYQP
jgi:hypothetical protein